MGTRREIFGQMIGIGQDILSAALNSATGAILAQLGDATSGVPDIDEAEVVQQPGFWSMPAAPTPNAPVNGGVAAQAYTIRLGDRDVVIAIRDVRTNQRYGNLKPGDTCVGASTGMASLFCRADDGSVTLATSDTNDRTGNSIFRKLSPTEDRFWSPFGSTLHDQTGWHLRTWHGAKIDVGGLGLPPPFSSLGLGSSAVITADMINISASVLSLGRGPITQAVVQALPLSLVLASVATALTSVGAVLTDLNAILGIVPAPILSGAPGAPVVIDVTAQTALVAAIGTASTDITTAVTQLATVNLPAAAGAGCATTTTVT